MSSYFLGFFFFKHFLANKHHVPGIPISSSVGTGPVPGGKEEGRKEHPEESNQSAEGRNSVFLLVFFLSLCNDKALLQGRGQKTGATERNQRSYICYTLFEVTFSSSLGHVQLCSLLIIMSSKMTQCSDRQGHENKRGHQSSVRKLAVILSLLNLCAYLKSSISTDKDPKGLCGRWLQWPHFLNSNC